MYIAYAPSGEEALEALEDLGVEDVVRLAASLVPGVVAQDALAAQGGDDLQRLWKNAHNRAFGRYVRLELFANARVRQ